MKLVHRYLLQIHFQETFLGIIFTHHLAQHKLKILVVCEHMINFLHHDTAPPTALRSCDLKK